MASVITLELPDEVYQGLQKIAKQAGQTPEALARDWVAAEVKSIENDPLLRLSGTIDSDISDVADRHDYYIGKSLLKEMRGETND